MDSQQLLMDQAVEDQEAPAEPAEQPRQGLLRRLLGKLSGRK